jgi:hypothetical protein
VNDKRRRTKFAPGDDVSIFFFTYPTSGYYVYIQRAERRGNSIQITYQFYPHLTRDMTAHFALIPLGKLPEGQYQARMVQDKVHPRFKQLGMEPPDARTVSQLIGKDFSFAVGKALSN